MLVVGEQEGKLEWGVDNFIEKIAHKIVTLSFQRLLLLSIEFDNKK